MHAVDVIPVNRAGRTGSWKPRSSASDSTVESAAISDLIFLSFLSSSPLSSQSESMVNERIRIRFLHSAMKFVSLPNVGGLWGTVIASGEVSIGLSMRDFLQPEGLPQSPDLIPPGSIFY